MQVGHAEARIEGWVADTDSWKRVSVALIAGDQIRPSAKRPTLSKESPSACIGGMSVAQATGTCRHAQNFAFLTACLEPGRTWGLPFSVVPFATLSALSECRAPRQCFAFSHLCLNTLFKKGVVTPKIKRGGSGRKIYPEPGFYPECFCHDLLGIYLARAGLETEDHRGMICLTTTVCIEGRAREFIRLKFDILDSWGVESKRRPVIGRGRSLGFYPINVLSDLSPDDSVDLIRTYPNRTCQRPQANNEKRRHYPQARRDLSR